MRQHKLSWMDGRLPKQLRALTIRQPWAWAVAHGFKPVENRNQALPGKFMGEIVAIHAGHARIDDDNVDVVERNARTPVDPAMLVTGAILGFARLVGSVRRRGDLKKAADRKWFSGPHGWLVEDTVLLDEPVSCDGQLGFWQVPRGVLTKLRAQVTTASTPARPKVFSWGYWGWGAGTRQVVEAFDAVEKARGFAGPLFIDIRARREVRSEGFSGPSSPFIRVLGRSRYRWLKELGNAAVTTGHGPMRLIAPQAIGDLLGLVLRAQQEQRRVVFFCACESPNKFHSCHRRLVAKYLVASARQLGLPLEVEEWPGGTPRPTPITVRVEGDEYDLLVAGREAIDLGRKRPNAKVLGLPIGSTVRVKSGAREGYASVAPPLFRRGRWQLPLYLTPFKSKDSRRLLAEAVEFWRRKDRLEPSIAVG